MNNEEDDELEQEAKEEKILKKGVRKAGQETAKVVKKVAKQATKVLLTLLKRFAIPIITTLIVVFTVISIACVIVGTISAVKDFFFGSNESNNNDISTYYKATENGIEIKDDELDAKIKELEDADYDLGAMGITKDFLKKFIQVSAATENVKMGNKGVQGIIQVYKTNSRDEGTSESTIQGKELKYQSEESFKESPDSDHYSIDTSGNLLVATWVSHKQSGGEVYSIETINFKATMSQYRVPLLFFIDLSSTTQNPKFVEAVADQVLKSKIILTLQETEREDVTVRIEKDTGYGDEKGEGGETEVETTSYYRSTTLNPVVTKADTFLYTKTADYKNKVSSYTTGTDDETTTTTINTYTQGPDKEPYYKNDEFEEILKTEYEVPTKETTVSPNSISQEDSETTDTETKKKGKASAYDTIIGEIDNTSFLFNLLNQDVENENLVNQFKYILYLITGKDYGVTSLDLDLGWKTDNLSSGTIYMGEQYWFPIAKEDIKTQYFTNSSKTSLIGYTTKADSDGSVVTSPMGPRVRETTYTNYPKDYTIRWEEYDSLTITNKEEIFSQKNGTVVADQHAGIDIGSSRVNGSNVNIIASKEGTVTIHSTASSGNSYGNCVDIQHSDGSVTRYGHLASISVTEGEKVAQGQAIGTMGATGGNYGVHLHFEIRINGEVVDPLDYLNMESPWKEKVTLGQYGDWTGGSRAEFITTLAPYAVQSMQTQGIYASVTIAQGILESGSGTSGLALKCNNFFGMKGGSDSKASQYNVYDVIKTDRGNDYWNGFSMVWLTSEERISGKIKAFFRKYENIGDSVGDHGRLLNDSNYSSKGVNKCIAENLGPQEQITRIRAAGYATDSSYVAKVMKIINSENLNKYDSMTIADFEDQATMGTITLTGENKTKMQQLITDAIRICNDDRYTYSQANRYGEFQYDCSSFVYRLYKQYFPEISVPTTSAYGNENLVSTIVNENTLKVGDVLWKTGHVGIYIGNGKYAHASTGKGDAKNQILISDLSATQAGSSKFTEVYRFVV